MSAWFVPTPAPAQPAGHLLLFPFAGGGAGVYRAWPEALPGWHVHPVALPGREARMREPALTRLDALLDALAPAVAALSGPIALFGHSLGALVAYTLARRLHAEGRRPVHLLVSARRAPAEPPPHGPLFALPEAALIDALERLYGPFPAVLKERPAVLRMFLPTLRADLQLLDTATVPADRALACPVTAFAAADDHAVPPATMARWAEVTEGSFALHTLPGGHFLPRDGDDLRQAVARTLRA